MAWFVLILAGLFEVAWVVSLKLSEACSRVGPSIVAASTFVASFALLSWSVRVLPLGTAYAVWTGTGTFGAFMVGILISGENMSLIHPLAAGLAVAGVMLMKLSNSQ